MRTVPITPEATDDGGLVVRVRPPGPSQPLALTLGAHVRGERVVLIRPDRWCYDLRATSNPYLDDTGRLMVQVVAEAQWYRFGITGEAMTPVEVMASTVFQEYPPAT